MDLSEGERLVLAMLCDIHKALNLKGAIDPGILKPLILDTGSNGAAPAVNGASGNDRDRTAVAGEVSEIAHASARGLSPHAAALWTDAAGGRRPAARRAADHRTRQRRENTPADRSRRYGFTVCASGIETGRSRSLLR
jgi:hypothetical protein